MNRGWTLPLLLLGLLTACGHHQPTVYVPANAASGSSTAPTTTSTPTPPPPGPTTLLTFEALGPGPARVATDATEALALAFVAENQGPAEARLGAVSLVASGRLNDAGALTTVRLAEDLDGDGRYDRAIDRVLSSGGFTQDDGDLLLNANVDLLAGDVFRGLVVLDFAGKAQPGDDLRLTLDPAATAATPLTGTGPVVVLGEVLAGPTLRVGGWVEPHLALGLPGDGLYPKAVRDNQGRTHLAVYQNYNGNSDVFYSLHDGRSYSSPDDVSRAPTGAWNQDLAVDAGRLPHLVWEEWDTGVGDYAIRYRRFDPVNFGWTPTEALSPAAGRVPRVAVTPAGAVHVVWEDAASSRVFHRHHDGQSWSSIAEVTSASAGSQARQPALAVLPGGDVLVAWAENEPSRNEIRVRRALPSGGYGQVRVAATPSGWSEMPQLLVDGSDVHLAFVAGGEIFHARDGGSGFSQPVDVSRSPLAGSSRPAMAVQGGALHLVWIEADVNLAGLANHVAHVESRGGGFSDPELLTRGPGDRSMPTVVGEGSRLRVIWQDWSLGRQRIFSSWKDDGLFEAPRAAASPGGDPGRPSAAEDGLGGLHVAYPVDAGGTSEVFVASEPDPITGFALAENVSRTPTSSYAPTVASFDGSLWAAWEEDAAGGFEIRVAQRLAGGWSSSAPISSGSPAYTPRLAANGQQLALSWTGADANGDHDLYLTLRDGQGWSPIETIAPSSSSQVWNPDLAFTGSGELALVWEDEGPSGREARFALRDAAGAVTTGGIATSPSSQYSPRVACQGDDVHVAWLEDGRVRVAVRPAGAADFDPPTDLASGGSASVDLCVAGDVILVAWEAWTGGDARVMHATLTPGSGWSAAVPLDLSRGPNRRVSTLGTSRGGARVLWTDSGSVMLRERRER